MPSPRKVVLADDDAHITCVVAMRLETAGYTVFVARDGEEALDLVRQNLPDLVITDLQMPRMSGLELSIKLGESPVTATIPIIMLTARGYLADESQMAKTSIKRVLPKPFSAREVLALAAEVIADNEKKASAA
jgi:two-component system alkaline phosphatase synthesis response regulator PhoP